MSFMSPALHADSLPTEPLGKPPGKYSHCLNTFTLTCEILSAAGVPMLAFFERSESLHAVMSSETS